MLPLNQQKNLWGKVENKPDNRGIMIWYVLLIFQFLPVAEGSETSPSEEENDKDSIEDDADEKGNADDDFQEHKNKKISIEIILGNNQSLYRQHCQIHCCFWNITNI